MLLIRGQRIELKEVEILKLLSVKAATDATFIPPGYPPPEPGQETAWHSRVRLAYAKTMMSLFDAAVRAIGSKQEFERRAGGFDYRLQMADKAEDEAGNRRRQEMIDSIHESVRRIAMRTEPAVIDAASSGRVPEPHLATLAAPCLRDQSLDVLGGKRPLRRCMPVRD